MVADREHALLFTMTVHYAIMPANSRLVSCSACIVLMILAGMAAGCLSSQTPPASAATPISTGGGNTIAIKNFAFAPPQMTVKAGTVVTWVNQDTAPHTIVSDTGSPAAFSSDSLVCVS